MSLQVKRENVPEKKVVLKTGEGEGSMIIRQAYGNESSLLVALRPPGYHTRPHMHASEQINHVLEGENLVLRGGQRLPMQEGRLSSNPSKPRSLGVESLECQCDSSRVSFSSIGRRRSPRRSSSAL
jgi:hypothetical protein